MSAEPLGGDRTRITAPQKATVGWQVLAFLTLFRLPGLVLLPFVVVPAMLGLPVTLRRVASHTFFRPLLYATALAVLSGIIMRFTYLPESSSAESGFAAASVTLWLFSISLIPAILFNLSFRMSVLTVTCLASMGAIVSTVITTQSVAWKGEVGAFLTLLLLALSSRRMGITRLVLVTSVGVSAVNDARGLALFGVLTLCVTFLTPKVRRNLRRHPLVSLVVVSAGMASLVWVYFWATLEGLLGSAAQARTAINAASENPVLSARVEWAAAWGLFRDRPLGFGIGSQTSGVQQADALLEVRQAGGDYTATYWREAVFAERHDLHSGVINLWFHFGIGGVLVAGLLIGLLAKILLICVSRPYSGGIVGAYMVFAAGWDVFFSPMSSSLHLMMALFLGAVFLQGSAWGASRRQRPDYRVACRV